MDELNIKDIIGKPESSTLEYVAVLPPSKNIAQLINSFANTEGGYIILGVSDNLEINGLSEDFHANSIIHKALDLLIPQPKVFYQYVGYGDKKLYVIKVDKSDVTVLLESKVYKRIGASTRLSTPSVVKFSKKGYPAISTINETLNGYKKISTDAKVKVIDHYVSVLKIIDDLENVLYPTSPTVVTTNQEGRILSRILFSSAVDNFETYLSDLLYEIFLANPATLKSPQMVTIEEVLNCSDLQEFVKYWAKQKLSKLQKGSVKGFIKENKQISELQVIDAQMQTEIEAILQIRHLYSHRNGIVDEKFMQYWSGAMLNSEHRMPISEILDKLNYLAKIINQIDNRAIMKFKLDTV